MIFLVSRFWFKRSDSGKFCEVSKLSTSFTVVLVIHLDLDEQQHQT